MPFGHGNCDIPMLPLQTGEDAAPGLGGAHQKAHRLRREPAREELKGLPHLAFFRGVEPAQVSAIWHGRGRRRRAGRLPLDEREKIGPAEPPLAAAADAKAREAAIVGPPAERRLAHIQKTRRLLYVQQWL
jgi:hypothetical protein